MGAIASWFEMGGYAGFVWPAYGIAAVVLGWLAFESWRRHRASAAALRQLEERAQERPRQ